MLNLTIVSSGAGASDHASFWNRGYSAILLIEDDFNEYYHTANDTLANLNMTYFTNNVKASVGTLAHLAIPAGEGSTPTPTPVPTATIPPGGDYALINQSGFSLVLYVDSEETSGEDGAATNFFDGDTSTFWHTEWEASNPPHPHEIQIDLGGTYNVGGIRYLPRQDDEVNGTIADYEVYVSTSTGNWGSRVAYGTFANDKAEKEVLFSSVTGRYIRFIALSEVNGEVRASGAEYNVLEYTGEATPTPTPAGELGDINGDGSIDIVDALLIAQCYVGISSCSPASIADINCDGGIDIVDALLIAQYYVGLMGDFC